MGIVVVHISGVLSCCRSSCKPWRFRDVGSVSIRLYGLSSEKQRSMKMLQSEMCRNFSVAGLGLSNRVALLVCVCILLLPAYFVLMKVWLAVVFHYLFLAPIKQGPVSNNLYSVHREHMVRRRISFRLLVCIGGGKWLVQRSELNVLYATSTANFTS